MTQAAIKKLVADSVSADLEAQAANMANADNTNRNTEEIEAHVARKYSYKDFMSCQPINFKDCKVKFVAGTLTKEALSCWNSFAQPIGIEEAYKITWVEFKKLLIKKYCPRTEKFSSPHSGSTSCNAGKMLDNDHGNTEKEKPPVQESVADKEFMSANLSIPKVNSLPKPIGIEEAYKITWVEFKKYCPQTEVQKMEDEFYHLTMKGNDLKTYVRRFQEFTQPYIIEGNVIASKPQSLEEAINIAQRLMDQNRPQETFRSYAVIPTKNNGYIRNRPLSKKCTLHHIGPCTVKCNTCNKVGHLTKNCRNKGPGTGSNLLPVTFTCHACGEKGHYANQY
ncbi:reverse transcriptase domain-containing protein [Tanacetum coccineum]